jgi:hypothetical protein
VGTSTDKPYAHRDGLGSVGMVLSWRPVSVADEIFPTDGMIARSERMPAVDPRLFGGCQGRLKSGPLSPVEKWATCADTRDGSAG